MISYILLVPPAWHHRYFGITLTVIITAIVFSVYIHIKEIRKSVSDGVAVITGKYMPEKEPPSEHLYNFIKNLVLLSICLGVSGYCFFSGIDLSSRDSWYSLGILTLVIVMLIIESVARYRFYRRTQKGE